VAHKRNDKYREAGMNWHIGGGVVYGGETDKQNRSIFIDRTWFNLLGPELFFLILAHSVYKI